MNIAKKMVLGTAQLGKDYGVANISGRPKRKEVFEILDLAWEKGIRNFDTAPSYGSEELLGEFLINNNLKNEVLLHTKLPSLEGNPNYKKIIRNNLESSLEKLGCNIEVLYFHDPNDSKLLLDDVQFFENLLDNYSVSTFGVSVYDTREVEKLSDCVFEPVFQFPYNVLDRRFENVHITKGKRYARSIFLQGLLVTQDGLRTGAPEELVNLQKEYQQKLVNYGMRPVDVAVSFVLHSDYADYFLVGADTKKQLSEILEIEPNINIEMDILDFSISKTFEKWLDPRTWN